MYYRNLGERPPYYLTLSSVLELLTNKPFNKLGLSCRILETVPFPLSYNSIVIEAV